MADPILAIRLIIDALIREAARNDRAYFGTGALIEDSNGIAVEYVSPGALLK